MSNFQIDSSTDISAVIKAHFAWKLRIKTIIEGTATELYDPEQIARDDQCVLGKWISTVAFSNIGQDYTFKQLQQKHANFHTVAAHTVELAQSGHKADALKEVTSGQYAKISKEVTGLLSTLYNKNKS